MHKSFYRTVLSLTFVFQFILVAQISAQDTLLLMNGHLMDCVIKADTGTVLQIALTKRNGKTKIREIHKSEIFSVKKAGTEEVIFYVKDDILGDVFTVEEMRFYIAGEGDARKNFHAWPVFYIGLIACGTIAYWGGDGYVTALGPPVAYVLVQLIGRVRVRDKHMSNPNYKYNDMYAYGFGPAARSKKMIRAFEGGFSGAALGVTLSLLLNK